MITGVILAGGLGTRLRSVLPDTPKVLAEVHGRPFLVYLLDQMMEAGIRRFLLCTGHLGEAIHAVLGDSYRGCPLLYSREKAPLGTAGALRQAIAQDPTDFWMVVNGDSFVATPLKPFLEWHQTHRHAASLLLAWVEDSSRFGTVDAASDGRVLGFREKRGVAEPAWINAGVYLLPRRLLQEMPTRAPLSLEREVMPEWVENELWGFAVKAPFIDIGTPESLQEAASFFRPRHFVVLDRDGTIIEEKNYLRSPDQVALLPQAAAGIRRLNELGFGVAVVTNQSGIGRGYFATSDVELVHVRMRDLLAERGAWLDGIYICPHTPDEHCDCRKPCTGMVEQAARELGFDPRRAFFAGDKACDIELGQAYGATTFLVQTGYGREQLRSGTAKPRFVVTGLEELAKIAGTLGNETVHKSNLVRDAGTRLRTHLLASITTKQRLLEECEPILDAAAMIVTALRTGGKLLLCGNGGSAADCQHIAGELVSVLNQSFPRPGLAALAMTTDSSILTASANDFGYEGIFERQTQALARPGDVLMGISTSGNSENVVRALRYAAAHDVRTLVLTGASGGKMAEVAEIAIRVPSAVVQHIQEAHITIGHILCDLIEQTIFGKD